MTAAGTHSLTIAGMTVPPYPEQEVLELAAAFPAAGHDRWQELVKGVLRKSRVATEDTPLDEVEELLATTTYDGITVMPLYTAADMAPGRPGLPTYARNLNPGSEVAAGWDVRQRHANPDPVLTREAIAADLENGVTSLWLVVGEAGIAVAELANVLRDVYLDLAPVVLDAGDETPQAAAAFLALAAGKAVSGGLGADPLSRGGQVAQAVDLAKRCVAEFPGIRAITVDATVHHDQGGSDVEELGCSVAAGVAYLRALTESGLSVEQALGQIEFRYAATADQFQTIAKLRAARRLWARVAEVSGAADQGQRQHAVTSNAMMTARDPWVNMLRTTIAAFAAGVGGADAVTVQPFDAVLGLPDDFARRIARNTHALLLEESSLSRVADPAGGSWYVERLTADMAERAWAWFQEIEKAGGLPAAGHVVRERLAATWAKRRDNLAHRRDPITGVSEYPNLAEHLPVRTRAAGAARGVRYAADFEALRDASDAAAQRPRVFLATLGSAAQHSGRAGFAANLFQAGGIETVQGRPEDFAASGATVACLCSGDKVYAEQAAGAAKVLKATGAKRIWLAGKGDYEGVDSYLYAGCDALNVLRITMDDCGVAR